DQHRSAQIEHEGQQQRVGGEDSLAWTRKSLPRIETPWRLRAPAQQEIEDKYRKAQAACQHHADTQRLDVEDRARAGFCGSASVSRLGGHSGADIKLFGGQVRKPSKLQLRQSRLQRWNLLPGQRGRAIEGFPERALLLRSNGRALLCGVTAWLPRHARAPGESRVGP